MTRYDVGTAPERTRFAWRRTVLSVAAIAVLCARLCLSSGLYWLVLPVLAAGAAAGVGQVRIRTLRAAGSPIVDAERSAAAPGTLALCVVGLAVLAILLVVLP
jgi:hypothetical protein